MKTSRRLFARVVLIALLATSLGAWTCNAQNVTQQILTWLPTISQAVVAVLQGVSALQGKTVNPNDIAAAQTWAANIKTDIQGIQDAVVAYNANPGASQLVKISAAYSKVVSEEAALLPALHIVDPATQSKVQAALGLIGVGLNTIGALIAELPPAPVGKVKASRVLTLRSPGEFKQKFNLLVTQASGSADVDAAFRPQTLR